MDTEPLLDRNRAVRSLLLQLDQYKTTGTIPNHYLGILHHYEPTSIVLPTPELQALMPKYHGKPNTFELASLPNEIGTRQIFIMPDALDKTSGKNKGVVAFESVAFEIVPNTTFAAIPTLPEELHALSWAGVEASFVSDGFGDFLMPIRLGMTYHTIERAIDKAIGKPLWSIQPSTREKLIKSFLATQSEIAEAFAIPFNSQEFSDSMCVLGDFLSYLAQGNIKAAQTVRRRNSGAVYTTGAYLYALMHANQATTIFPSDTNNLLKKAVLTLSRAECAPNVEDWILPVDQSRYSTYLGLALDAAILKHAPFAFALGNAGLGVAVDMQNANYLLRMRATRANIDFDMMVNKLLASDVPLNQRGFEARFHPFLSPKSVFTALSEAINETLKTHPQFVDLLSITEADMKLPQMVRDYELIERFNTLIQNDSYDQDPDVLTLISEVYSFITKTPDACRGTIAPENTDLDLVVANALSDQQINTVIMILDFHEKGSHPRVVDLRNIDDVQKLITALGLPLDSSPSALLSHWYKSHKGQYPYGAVHFFATSTLNRAAYRQEAPDQPQYFELRVIPHEHIKDAIESRVVFKWDNSDHLVVGQR